MNISTATTSIAKSGQDIMAASIQMLSNVPEPADQQLSTVEAQTKTEPQSTEGDYFYTNDHQFQKFLRRFGGKRKGPQSSKPTRQGASSPKYYESAQKRRREQSDGPRKRVADTLAQSTIIENMRRPDVFLENGDTNDSDDAKDDGNSTDSDKYQATSMGAPGLDLARDKHLEHWRAWCQRKRYPDDMITGEKYGTYMKESLSPMVYRHKNNPYLEILPIRVDSSYNEEGEIPAWEEVVCHISSIRSLYLSQCEGNGVRPDIDGTMARPETVAAISKFRSM
ncbi:MAG: hypothetical protein J3R72DRAFT_419396 [Linnemannia gamsii]|nr:MAG: hypothetical protein J3R72DRAFT_419396 [Linnemannia gamsii]